MLKVVIIIAIAYMLWRMFESEKRKKQEKEQQEKDELIATGVVVKDPECGTYVDAESAIRVRDGAAVHCFCSYDCRDVFLKKRGIQLPQAEDEQDACEQQNVSGEESKTL